MTYFVGVGHYKRTGKDTFANMLLNALREYGVNTVKRSFAWKLKDICHQLYGWAELREPEFYDTPEGEKLREVVLPKIGLSPRQVWIKFGTDAVRNNVYHGTWLDYLLYSDHGADVVIVPDVRFQNEFDAISGHGGYTIKVVRPGFVPAVDNEPDCQLIFETRWDAIIGATGSLDDLKDYARSFARNFVNAGRIFPLICPDGKSTEERSLYDAYGPNWKEKFARYAAA